MHIEKIKYKAVRGLNYLWGEKEPWPIVVKPSQFNLLIGPNGGGKTTILDIVRTLSDPGLISSIARENHVCMDSSIQIETTTGVFTATIRTDGDSDNILARRAVLRIRNLSGEHLVDPFPLNFKHGDPINPGAIPLAYLSGQIRYLDCTKRSNVDIDALARAINTCRTLFPQVCQEVAAKAIEVGGGRLWVHFEAENAYSEDGTFIAPGQANAVPYEQIPSGWIAAARLINFLESCPRGAVILIEEPETCLHPLLQRQLMKWVLAQAEDRNLQIFASSHSSLFINVFAHIPGGAVFCAMTHEVKRWDASPTIVAALGVVPSDILHANGIIWVEGESDRIYLEAWLDEYCAEKDLIRPKRGIDYAVMSYGGAMLAHVLFGGDDGMNALTVNRNAALIADRDDDYRDEEFVGVRAYKERARLKLEAIGAFCWITEGRTIEDYLPEGIRPKNFSKGKVVAAVRAIAKAHSENVGVMSDSLELRERLRSLLQVINGWGQGRMMSRCNAAR